MFTENESGVLLPPTPNRILYGKASTRARSSNRGRTVKVRARPEHICLRTFALLNTAGSLLTVGSADETLIQPCNSDFGDLRAHRSDDDPSRRLSAQPTKDCPTLSAGA